MSRTCSTNFPSFSFRFSFAALKLICCCCRRWYGANVFQQARMRQQQQQQRIFRGSYFIIFYFFSLMLFRFCNVFPVCICVAEQRVWSARALLYNFRLGCECVCVCEFDCNINIFLHRPKRCTYTFYEWNRIATQLDHCVPVFVRMALQWCVFRPFGKRMPPQQQQKYSIFHWIGWKDLIIINMMSVENAIQTPTHTLLVFKMIASLWKAIKKSRDVKLSHFSLAQVFFWFCFRSWHFFTFLI